MQHRAIVSTRTCHKAPLVIVLVNKLGQIGSLSLQEQTAFRHGGSTAETFDNIPICQVGLEGGIHEMKETLPQ